MQAIAVYALVEGLSRKEGLLPRVLDELTPEDRDAVLTVHATVEEEGRQRRRGWRK
jgi:hypothetical protein